MASPSRGNEKQIRVAVFDNEPMARLAVQRLQEMGIPSLTRCLRGGPGLWGSAYNLPHDIVVYESDENQAREVLELGPSENLEAEEQAGQPASTPGLGPILVGAVLGVLFLVVMVSVFSRPF